MLWYWTHSWQTFEWDSWAQHATQICVRMHFHVNMSAQNLYSACTLQINKSVLEWPISSHDYTTTTNGVHTMCCAQNDAHADLFESSKPDALCMAPLSLCTQRNTLMFGGRWVCFVVAVVNNINKFNESGHCDSYSAGIATLCIWSRSSHFLGALPRIRCIEYQNDRQKESHGNESHKYLNRLKIIFFNLWAKDEKNEHNFFAHFSAFFSFSAPPKWM